jgi:hypothetical protein
LSPAQTIRKKVKIETPPVTKKQRDGKKFLQKNVENQGDTGIKSKKVIYEGKKLYPVVYKMTKTYRIRNTLCSKNA